MVSACLDAMMESEMGRTGLLPFNSSLVSECILHISGRQELYPSSSLDQELVSLVLSCRDEVCI